MKIFQSLGCLTILGLTIGCHSSNESPDKRPNPAPDETSLNQDTPEPFESAAPASQKSMPNMKGMGKMMAVDPDSIQFKDDVESNTELPKNLGEIVFTDKNGDKIALKDFVGKKNVVLVFTEGFNGMLCPFCQTQTSRLIANYDKFTNEDTEILVVYPGKRDHLDEFITAALKSEKSQVDKVPFPIVLDEDFTATNFFAIRSKHAHPSTFIIDKTGGVQLAYVGADMTADRPSIKAILEKLRSVNQ